jgi:hypothetical protein
MPTPLLYLKKGKYLGPHLALDSVVLPIRSPLFMQRHIIRDLQPELKTFSNP